MSKNNKGVAPIAILILVALGTLFIFRDKLANLTIKAPTDIVISGDTATYTNHDFGYSIDFPALFPGSGPCVWEKDSYRPARPFIPVPLTVIEDKTTGISYVTYEYDYILTGESADDSGYHTYSGCKKTNTTLQNLDNLWSTPFRVVVHRLGGETLQSKIKTIFGSDCRVGSQAPSRDQGGYNVSVLGGKYFSAGEPPEDIENCTFPNYRRLVRYYPKEDLLVDIIKGNPQDYSFFSDQEPERKFDEEIADSFRLIK